MHIFTHSLVSALESLFLCKRNTVEFFFIIIILSHKSLKPNHDCNCFFPPPSPVRVLGDLALALVGHARAEELVGVRGVERGGLAAAGGLHWAGIKHNLAYIWQSRILYSKFVISSGKKFSMPCSSIF